ncbi:MAG: hypothetical protein U0W40_03635 [Acidimicrobiia bacterium]
MLDVVRRVCNSARDAGAHVVHCTAVNRADGASSAVNCKIFALGEKVRAACRVPIRPRSVRRVPSWSRGLEDECDIVLPRIHGMTPFTSTSLDQILRNLGVRTVVRPGCR